MFGQTQLAPTFLLLLDILLLDQNFFFERIPKI